jgi:parallel beta-helix repeat protein
MGNDVGMNNVVFDNEIYLNNGNGVAVDTVFCTPGNETIIAANRIYSNTWHGIELSGNYHIVEQNVVYANGENPDGSDDMVGHSGIHLFSRYHENDPDLGGDYNIIRYNLLYDNRDNEPNATDGNGIQMDMWCDDNQVYNNIAYDNDGPGVIIFGGSRNLIYNNTLFDNGRHLGWRRARTQLMVADSDEVGAAMNKIYNNIGFSQDAAAYAAYIDAGARARNNIFSHNLWHNATGGNLLGLGDNGSVSLTTWNAESWAHDFSGDPQFVDAVSHDFQLRFGSPAIDAADPAYAPDDDFITASRPQGAVPDIGAYEYQYHQVSMPVITISALNSTDVRLTWEHNDHCARYEFWRDASPYFSPSGDAIQTSYDASQSWDDAGVLGDAGVNHYYIARCIHYNQALTNSNRTGEFDFALVRALN